MLGSKALLFCKESPALFGFLEDGKNCIMFRDDLSDFKEKMLYYTEKDVERDAIIERGYDLFIKNHTWNHRVNFLLNRIKETK